MAVGTDNMFPAKIHIGQSSGDVIDLGVGGGDGIDTLVWDETFASYGGAVEFIELGGPADDAVQSAIKAATDTSSSPGSVPGDADPNNLSPQSLECYCSFQKPRITTAPASAFNNNNNNAEATASASQNPAFLESDEHRVLLRGTDGLYGGSYSRLTPENTAHHAHSLERRAAQDVHSAGDKALLSDDAAGLVHN